MGCLAMPDRSVVHGQAERAEPGTPCSLCGLARPSTPHSAESSADPDTWQLFSPPGDASILPLRVIPQEVVDLVLLEGLPPHGRCCGTLCWL